MIEQLPACILVGVKVCSLRNTLAEYLPVTVCVCDDRRVVALAETKRILARLGLKVETVDWMARLEAGLSIAQPDVHTLRRLAGVQGGAISLQDLCHEVREADLVDMAQPTTETRFATCTAA